MTKVANISDIKKAVDEFLRRMKALGIEPGVEIVNTPDGKFLVVAFTAEEFLESIRKNFLDKYKTEINVIPLKGVHWLRIAVKI